MVDFRGFLNEEGVHEWISDVGLSVNVLLLLWKSETERQVEWVLGLLVLLHHLMTAVHSVRLRSLVLISRLDQRWRVVVLMIPETWRTTSISHMMSWGMSCHHINRHRIGTKWTSLCHVHRLRHWLGSHHIWASRLRWKTWRWLSQILISMCKGALVFERT